MSRNLTVTYELNPPQGVVAQGLERKHTLSYPIASVTNGEGGNRKYYDDLRAAIAQAKDAVGEDLTAWRDAVGNSEQSKEPKTSKASEDDGDEEQDDAEGEQ